jgi:4-carboxymuconolactone decarboxylase
MNSITPKGNPAPKDYFTGTVYVNMVVSPDDNVNSTVAKVTFEAKARTNWHTHDKGQILIVTDGVGYYQEKGQPIQLIQNGDVIKILPGVVHWHGASHGSAMTHIAIIPDTSKEATDWMLPVTNAEYDNLN